MKKNLIYAGMLLLGMTVATGCSNEESLEQVLNNGNVIEAVIENPTKGRTSVSDNYQVLWTAEDAFSVFDNGTKKATLTLSGGEGTTSGKFTIDNNDVTITEDMVALFPASETLSYTFAKSYTNQETDAPMSATFADGKFTFSLLTAMVRVVVEDVPAGDVSMTISSNDLVLTGEATLSNSALSVPTTGENSVSVNFKTTEAGTLTFDVPVPVQNYTNGLSVIVKSDDTEVLNKTTNGFNAAAGKLYLFGAAYVSVSNAEAATEQLKEDGITAVKVQSVEADDVIAIPAKSEASAQTEHIIDLSSATLPTDGSVSIDVTEATDGDTESTVEKLTVIVPDNTTSGSLTINAPGTTVTIQGADGTVIDTIEATTAENTLIVGAGVTVKSLTINKGNVVLEDGANVELFKVNDPAGFKTAFALGGNIELQNDIDLALTSSTALTIESGKTVSIDLNNNKLTTSQSVGTADDIIVQGKLNILNGTIETSNTAFFVKDGGELKLDKCEIISNAPTAVAMSVKDTSKLEATDCTVTTKGSSFRVRGGSTMVLTNCNTSRSEDGTGKTPLVLAEGQSTILTISGGSYTSKEYEEVHDAYAIGVTSGANATINTTVSGGNGGVTVIGASTANLTGGSYSGVKACGLYIDGGSTVKYSNCTFSGVEGDVIVGNQNGGGTVNGTNYTEYAKFEQASTSDEVQSILSNGGNVTLASAIELTTATTVAANKEVTIDLNGYKLTTSQSVGTADDIIVQGKLNIFNGTIETSNTAFFVKDGGELKLDKCEIISNAPTAVAMSVKGNSKLEATDCTVTTMGSSFRVRGGSTMVLTNCNTSRSEDGTGKTPLVLAEDQNTILTISGGSYTSKEYEDVYDAYAIGVTKGANATINTIVSGGNGGVTVIGASTANLTGGSYSGVKACGLYIDGGSTVKYSNCTFSGVEGAVVVGNQNGGGTVNDTKYTVHTKIQ